MSKFVKFNDEARQVIKDGIDILANSVKVTLGPQGRTVIIDEQFNPHITKDGVSVAKAIVLEDPFQNVGAQIVKQVASKTCDDAGDGTTTATVLAQSMIQYGLRLINSGANPVEIKEGINKKVKEIVEFIKKFSESIGNDYDKIRQIATISANNDEEIGTIIADAMKEVSQDGVITVTESHSRDTSIEVVKGMQFDRGYLSPYFVTDTEKMECEMENPLVLVTDYKINNLKEFLPILNPIVQTGRPIVIIAEDIDNEVLNTLVVNKMRTQLKICAVKAPGFGDRRKAMLEDIAILTGGTLITSSKGISFSNATLRMLGSANKINISKNNTTIIGGCGIQENIMQRAEDIRNLIQNCKDNSDLAFLKNRLAKIVGGVAIIHLGASSELELQEKKDRVDDALCATRAAIEEGIVPGGGTTYLRALQNCNLTSKIDDELAGMSIVEKSLTAPISQIILNAGKSPDVIIAEVLNGDSDWGYDAKKDEFCNLKSRGIIDPAKVTRSALENAASIASLFLTTECVITNPYKNNE